jgi:carbamoyl-phosphate synthase large subunit
LPARSFEDRIGHPVGTDHFAARAVVFPFSRFEGVNPFLGPEMRSTGEVMGIAPTCDEAYSKAPYAAGIYLQPPGSGRVFRSVNDRDTARALPVARRLVERDFGLPLITALSAAEAALGAIARIGTRPLVPVKLQEL